MSSHEPGAGQVVVGIVIDRAASGLTGRRRILRGLGLPGAGCSVKSGISGMSPLSEGAPSMRSGRSGRSSVAGATRSAICFLTCVLAVWSVSITVWESFCGSVRWKFLVAKSSEVMAPEASTVIVTEPSSEVTVAVVDDAASCACSRIAVCWWNLSSKRSLVP